MWYSFFFQILFSKGHFQTYKDYGMTMELSFWITKNQNTVIQYFEKKSVFVEANEKCLINIGFQTVY